MRVPVVAVEVREDGPFVRHSRALGVPILFADGIDNLAVGVRTPS